MFEPALRFNFETPVVGGPGADLPALLGLKSMTSRNAVLQMQQGRECLTFPGVGGYEIQWSPGTIHIPLDRAPSGHLVFRTDAFDRVLADESRSSGSLHHIRSEVSHGRSVKMSLHVTPEDLDTPRSEDQALP